MSGFVRVLVFGCVVMLAACGGTGSTTSTSPDQSSGGLSGGVSGSKPVTTPPKSSAVSTSPPAPAVTGGAVASPPATGNWDGTHFDYGHIVAVTVRDGQTVIVFDREQLFTPDGLKSGKELTEEPVRWGNSDVPSVNDSPNTRDYVLAPGAEILYLEYPKARCMDMQDEAPNWRPISSEALIGGAFKDRSQVALTFNATGQVSRVRLATSC